MNKNDYFQCWPYMCKTSSNLDKGVPLLFFSFLFVLGCAFPWKYVSYLKHIIYCKYQDIITYVINRELKKSGLNCKSYLCFKPLLYSEFWKTVCYVIFLHYLKKLWLYISTRWGWWYREEKDDSIVHLFCSQLSY